MINPNVNCDCGCKGERDCAHIKNPKCSTCGDELHNSECADGVCWTCKQLENNRRYRVYNNLGEYAK